MTAFTTSLESSGLYWLVVWALAATAVWGAATAIVACLRRHSAHARHRVWAISTLIVLVAPLLAPALPVPRWWNWAGKENAVQVAGGPSLEHGRSGRQPATENAGRSFTKAPANDRTNFNERLASEEASSALVSSGPQHAVNFANEESAPPRTLTWRTALVATWLAGNAVSLLLLTFGIWRVRRMRVLATRVTGKTEIDLCHELCRSLGIRRDVDLLVTPQASVPLLAGAFGPAILLPTGFGRWSADRMRVVLTHELIHLKRRDVWWEIVAQLAKAPTWFHPLAWYAARRLRIERELACDDAVISSGARPADYAEQLVEVAGELRRVSWRPAPVVAIVGASPIERRVRSILDPRTWRAPLGRWRSIALMSFLASLVVVVAALSPTSGQEKEQRSPASPPAATAAQPRQMDSDHLSAEIAANERRIADELDKPTSLHLENVSLEDALLALSKRHGIPIRLATWSYAQKGVILATQVTLIDEKTTLRKALMSLIESASGGAKIESAVRPKDGVLSVVAANVDDAEPRQLNSETDDRVIARRGAVRTVDGKAAAGCEIVVHTWTHTIVLCADDRGEFILPMRPNPTAILMRSASGGEQAVYKFENIVSPSRGVEPLNVMLQKSRPITVVVTDGMGKPIPRARAAITGTQGAFDQASFNGLTDDAGEFTARVPEKLEIGYISAFKPGAGLDYHSYVKSPHTTDLQVKAPQQPAGSVQLVLAAARSITIKYVEDDGKPIAGLMVYPWYFQKPGESDDLNISGVLGFYAATNATGEVIFDWIPKWQVQQIVFWPQSNQFYQRERLVFDPKEPPQSPLTVTLRRVVEIAGTLRDTAGHPVANADVEISGKGWSLDDFRTTTKSDAQGRYRVGVAPYNLYMLAATSADRSLASPIRDGIAIYPRKPVSGLDLTLQPATRVFGRLTRGPKNEPIKDYSISLYAYGRDLNNLKEVDFPHDPKNHWWIQPMIVHWLQTDSEGRYEFRVGPGKYDVRGTQQNDVRKFDVADEKELEFNFHSERPDSGTLHGKVVTGDPAGPVPEAQVEGVTQDGSGTEVQANANPEGVFIVTRGLHPAVFYACTKDRALAGFVEIGRDDPTVTIPIAPTASYTARILDEQKNPLSQDRKIEFGVMVHNDRKDKSSPFRWCFGGIAQPDNEGRVRFAGLVVGAKYDVELHNLDGNSFHGITSITPKEPGEHDLGDLVAKPPKPYHPPTLEEQISGAFNRPASAIKRNRDAKDFARLADARVLITFANPQGAVTKALYKLYFEDDTLPRIVNDNYRTVAIPTGGEKRAAAEALAKELGVELPGDDSSLVVAEGTDGKVLGVLTAAELVTKDKQIDKDGLLAFIRRHAPPAIDARKLLDDALALAKRENKRVLVQETAVWCGPCHRLATFLDANQPLWEKDYLWVRMDIRWNGEAEIVKSLRGKAEGGYPWLAILDADGKVLATSNKPDDGSNIGFPSEPDSIDHFIHMLKTTAQRITVNDLSGLKSALEAVNREK